jgi:hypothetical protein
MEQMSVTRFQRDLSDTKVDDFVWYNWLNDDVLKRSAVNFLGPQTFMQVVPNAIFRSAFKEPRLRLSLKNIDISCILQ